MDLGNTSPKLDLSPSDSVSDPEEKEISDDDDDRNHKHRRRETQSQSMERDLMEQVSIRPYIKRNKVFQNGHPYRDANSQSNDSSRNYNMSALEKGFPGKFDKRRPDSEPMSRSPSDFNHRIRVNQSLSSDPTSVRGRGREPGFWSQHDSMFTPPMVQQASLPSNLFVGRGMPTVSNPPGSSWSTFGLVPGLPSGVMDTLHSRGLQGNLRAPINPTINLGIPHQRCRDFEERGFCLRGDMCPMEHGTNRIVVEDVQSLSQFNLPVSLPSALLSGASAGPGPLSALSAASRTLSNRKGLYSRSIKSGVGEEGLHSNNACSGSDGTGGGDFYDPDQPLWTNDTEPLPCNQTKVDEAETVLDYSDDKNIGFHDGSDNDHPVKTNEVAGSPSTSLSVQAQIRSSKNITEGREIDNSGINTSNYTGNTTKDDQKLLKTAQGGAAQHGKQTGGRSFQKAQRTLFVNGIPPISNTRDTLLSHFRKFGEVIDIYIPLNGERAFVQFSKREEAEEALKAPDAVMGNRFIKLWWANRDNIPESGISSGGSVPRASPVLANVAVPACPVLTNRGKDNPQTTAPKRSIAYTSVSSVVASEHPKPELTNAPLPPTQKKLDSLEALKELRTKQEMLDQKRNELKRKLDMYEKQAACLKGDASLEQTTKRHKLGTMAGAAKATTPTCTGPSKASKHAETITERSRNVENMVPQSPKTCTTVALQETLTKKQSIRPAAPVGAPFVMNRFKLDNRPTTFKIVPPLPTALANVDALKEHFSAYGEVSAVNLEDSELKDDIDESVLSKSPACIHFTTRHSAEKAFSNGKCWKGHNMQFIWLTPSNSSKNISVKETLSSASSKGSSDVNDQTAGEAASTVYQKTVISGDGESEVSERRDRVTENVGHDEEFHSISSPSGIQEKNTSVDAC